MKLKLIARRCQMPLLAITLLSGLPAALYAQSVSFTGVQTTAPASGLFFPAAVAVDRAGDLFIADTGNRRVVEVTPSGMQTTVPVSGPVQPEGVAVDRAGNLFIADPYNHRVVEVPAGGGAQTTVGSGLIYPYGVAADGAGDVFIADAGANRVVEVTPGGAQTTVPVGGLNFPLAVAVDGAGTVFIADTSNNRVVEVTPSGMQTTVPVSGQPYGVAVDRAGNLFIADNYNNRVVEVMPGGAQTTVGSGLNHPNGVAVNGAGDLFIADYYNNRVVEVQRVSVDFGDINIGSSATLTLNYDVTAGGVLGTAKVLTGGAPNLDFTLAGGTCSGSVTASSSCTVNVTFTPRFAGARNGDMQIVDASGNVLATTYIHGIGVGPQIAFGPGTQTTVPANGLSFPYGAAVDGAGDVFIADPNNNRVVEVTPGGTQTTVGSGLNYPHGVAVDGAGDVFIADAHNNRVVEVTPSGAQTTVGSGLNNPYGVAVDGAGDVFIADGSNNRVVEVTPSGAQITVGSGLYAPQGVAVDGAGDVFIADSNNNRVVEVTPSGTQTTVDSGLSFPSGVAVDGAGDVFIADSGNNRVVEVPAGGGAPITVASGLNAPSDVAVDGAGDLFIADTYYNRVVEVNRSQPPTLSFAATNVNSTNGPQSVTVENIGNSPLSAISPGLAIGPNFAQVTGSGTPADCTASFSLIPGADCNLSISFTPTVSGALNGTATLTDNSGKGSPATQTIPLTGTGVALSQTISFAPLANQVQGTSVMLSASATSGLPVSFSSLTPSICTVSGTTATLINPGTCNIQASQPGNAQYAAATPVAQGFTVSPAANFTITPIPPTEIVYRGRLGGVILKLQSVQGFNANVTLSCAGGPAGSKCADLPQTVHVNGTAYAVSGVLFPQNAKPGTYTLTFTGASGSLTNSTTAKFTVK